MLDESALEVGDLVFFMNALGQPDHIAIYCGLRDGTPYIAHAVSEPYNSVMVTRMKHQDIPYQIFRPQNLALGLQAALRMQIWFEHQLPFSQNKVDFISRLEDLPQMSHPHTGSAALLAYAQEHFHQTFYQLVSYAAHPNTPYFPTAPEPIGMRCSEAIVAAFGIEQLLSANAVQTCAALQANWVSDNLCAESLRAYTNALPNHKKPPQSYENYYQHKTQDHTYSAISMTPNSDAPPSGTIPSFAAWNYQAYPNIDSFFRNFDFALPLDSMVAHPISIYHYVRHHPEQWQAIGIVNVMAQSRLPEQLEADKQKWRAHIASIFDSATQKRDELMLGTGLAALFSSPPRPAPMTPARRARRNSDGESAGTTSLRDQAQQQATRRLNAVVTPHRTRGSTAARVITNRRGAHDNTNRPRFFGLQGDFFQRSAREITQLAAPATHPRADVMDEDPTPPSSSSNPSQPFGQ